MPTEVCTILLCYRQTHLHTTCYIVKLAGLSVAEQNCAHFCWHSAHQTFYAGLCPATQYICNHLFSTLSCTNSSSFLATATYERTVHKPEHTIAYTFYTAIAHTHAFSDGHKYSFSDATHYGIENLLLAMTFHFPYLAISMLR